MEPAFHRGDLLFLTNRIEDPIRVGEIVVFRIEGREIPIVHRVLKIHEKYVKNLRGLYCRRLAKLYVSSSPWVKEWVGCQ